MQSDKEPSEVHRSAVVLNKLISDIYVSGVFICEVKGLVNRLLKECVKVVKPTKVCWI
jgi:hypothetical protein